MCGIFGGTIGSKVAETCLGRIHRGNDGNQVMSWPLHDVSFAFKRHSIIAPTDACSMQPVSTIDQKTHLVFNGEIFNYIELRKDLIKKGFTFQSEGDAEVLLNLFKSRGDAFCDNLDSMYAGAIFDESGDDPRILIFRDWVGELPLHYIYKKEEKRFIFSSEIKGFLGLGNYRIDDIQTLEPGTIFEVNLKDFSSRQWKYTRLKVDSNKYIYQNLKQIGEEVLKRLKKSASERVIADVPVCTLISGGIDSAITAYLLKELLREQGKELFAYCFHIEGEPIVEGTDLYHARIVAKELGLEKNFREVIVPKDDAVAALPEVIYALEDKRLKDFNIYPSIYNWFIAKRLVQDGFKVVFTGEGSDELFGSYGSWGSFDIKPEEITAQSFRLRLVENLHKGVLVRTSKVMMYAGPIEMRTFFLSQYVSDYIVNIPPEFLRQGQVWKMPLVSAFSGLISPEILNRPKARPQDSTGIMNLRNQIIETYKMYGNTDKEIFDAIFKSYFAI